jgi:hypothetical protein
MEEIADCMHQMITHAINFLIRAVNKFALYKIQLRFLRELVGGKILHLKRNKMLLYSLIIERNETGILLFMDMSTP